jgi:hypothetical protein
MWKLDMEALPTSRLPDLSFRRAAGVAGGWILRLLVGEQGQKTVAEGVFGGEATH